VLLGFNPVGLSRNVAVEKWDKTFRTVAQDLGTINSFYWAMMNTKHPCSEEENESLSLQEEY
jgi:hypothetical protein